MKAMMKRTAFFLFALAATMTATAQEQIESPIVSEKDFVWYSNQKSAWQEAVRRNPNDESAWLNYYNAARYMGWWGDNSDSIAHQIVVEMGQAIPNTYTYNMCAYMAIKLGHGEGTDGDAYAEAALAMLPDDMRLNDYNEWVCYLAMKGQMERMGQMAKRYFNSGLYSENVLRYSYNELAGMDEGGIILASGDAAVIPKWLIQEGMGEHRDKTIVCIPFLAVKEYREWLFRKLGIDVPEWNPASGYDVLERTLLQAIIGRYGHRVYFSSTTPPSTMEPWKTNLYNEGLLLKYSPKPYDNMAVKRRNVEQRYMMEYLLVSFRPEWTSGERLSVNYAVLLADLLPYYAKHDQERYKWLMNILVRAVSNTSLTEEQKLNYLNFLTDK